MIAPQDRDGGDLSWLFQLIAVFVFFVLPVVRSVAEARKKGREGAAGRPARPAKAPAQRSGREQWRDLLEGREPQAPVRRPAAPAPAPAPRPAARASDAPVAPRPAPRVEVAPRPMAPLPPAAPVLATLSESAPLEVNYTPKSSELGASELDPATLDDEMAARWGEGRPAAGRSPLAAALLDVQDWRRAVLLSEVLSPPLALRGRTGAWPGPPACMSA